MRISTSMMYDLGASRISDMQGTMVKTQQQISSMKRILTPADDPIGSARVLELSQGKSINEQFAVNRQHAKSLLTQEESTLGDLTRLVQDVQTLVVQAGNPTLGDEQRGYLATELKGHFERFMSLANSKDGTGNYIFGGYNVKVPPFSVTATGAAYKGDQGQRELQIDSNRLVALSDSGSDIFERVRTGNGTFATAPDPGNAGNGVISPGLVVNASELTNREYRLEFIDTDGALTYQVYDQADDPPVPLLLEAASFDESQPIVFRGMQFEIKGRPSVGDSFTIEPSGNRSVFASIRDLITALDAPAQSDVSRAQLQHSLNTASLEMASMLENVLTVRASVGTRLQEVEMLDESGMNRELFYEEAISDLQDLDYVKALSDLARQQVMLEAAQKTFVTVSGLSLFKMI